jgi:hypothetical protein
MPLKMTMMFKKYIITLRISNCKLKESVIMAGFLIYKFVIKIYLTRSIDYRK